MTESERSYIPRENIFSLVEKFQKTGEDEYKSSVERDIESQQPYLYDSLQESSSLVQGDRVFKDGAILTYDAISYEDKIKDIPNDAIDMVKEAFRKMVREADTEDGVASAVIFKDQIPRILERTSPDFYRWANALARKFENSSDVDDFMTGVSFMYSHFYLKEEG